MLYDQYAFFKKNIIISDDQIMLDSIKDFCSNITLINSNYNDFISSERKIDIIIIDKKVNIKKELLFRINHIINFTKQNISDNEIMFLKPIKLDKLLYIISKLDRDKSLFCSIGHSWIYSQADSCLKSPNYKIVFTEKENEIFSSLLLSQKLSLDKDYLRKKIWKYSKNSISHTIETHLYKLKQKLPKEMLRIDNNRCFLKVS